MEDGEAGRRWGNLQTYIVFITWDHAGVAVYTHTHTHTHNDHTCRCAARRVDTKATCLNDCFAHHHTCSIATRTHIAACIAHVMCIHHKLLHVAYTHMHEQRKRGNDTRHEARRATTTNTSTGGSSDRHRHRRTVDGCRARSRCACRCRAGAIVVAVCVHACAVVCLWCCDPCASV